jgi:hypothetical protein
VELENVGLAISLLYVELELAEVVKVVGDHAVGVVKVVGGHAVGELAKGPRKVCDKTSVIGFAMLLFR